MRTDDIRLKFIDFFKSKGHRHVPSDLLSPKNDPSLLFTGAGMNQFKEQFAGRDIVYRRAATYQKCLRTGDLENVGRTKSHHTFFEMLGNFSFGDYFKKEAIAWAWEFLTEVLRLSPDDLSVSVYLDDDEAFGIWQNDIRIPASKIRRLGDNDNFWPANAREEGPNGPCGPCSEIFYRDVEIWNLVFTQFSRLDGGMLAPLPSKNIDTGMGLERLARVMQGGNTNFDIDIFAPLREALRREADLPPEKENAVMDHVRAGVFCIGDNVLPANEGRNYVVRKLIRRAYLMGRASTGRRAFLYKMVPAVIAAMRGGYPELERKRDDIASVIKREEEAFEKRFDEFQPLFAGQVKKLAGKGEKTLPAAFVFYGYDTCGIPVDVQEDLAREEGLSINAGEVEKLIEDQKKRSREGSSIAQNIFGNDWVNDEDRKKINALQVDGESTTSDGYKILWLVGPYPGATEGYAIVSPKPARFYCEGGGQVGDIGELITKTGDRADIVNTFSDNGKTVFKVKCSSYERIVVGDTVKLNLNKDLKEKTARNHTATHLLHYALRKVLGEHVTQAGSLVAPDRLRFDFTHNQKVSADDIAKVERIVNLAIANKDPVKKHRDLTIEEAKGKGAISLFGEKYGDRVTVIDVGGYSREFCGGTHVDNADEIEAFKIIAESSVASGIRRVEALTGEAARKWIRNRIEEPIREIEQHIKFIGPDEMKRAKRRFFDVAENLKAQSKRLEGEIADIPFIEAVEKFYPITIGTDNAILVLKNYEHEIQKGQAGKKISEFAKKITSLLNESREINGVKVICGGFEEARAHELRQLKDIVKSNNPEKIAVFFAGSEGEKKSLLLWFSDDLVKAGRDAGSVIRDIAARFNAKGGGKSDMAQAGVRTGENLDAIVATAREILQEEFGR